MIASRIRSLAQFFICILIGAVFSSVIAFAWTGPTQTAPNGNVSAPVNVGTTYQEKQGILGALGILNTGSLVLFGENRYLAFNSTTDAAGYGIRDNAGNLEFKSSGSSWRGFLPSTGVQSITFADGTTQTTAASGVQFGSTFPVSAGGGWPTRTYQCPSNSVMVGINVTPGGSGDYVSSIVCQALN